jgi:hypothetical protein
MITRGNIVTAIATAVLCYSLPPLQVRGTKHLAAFGTDFCIDGRRTVCF